MTFVWSTPNHGSKTMVQKKEWKCVAFMDLLIHGYECNNTAHQCQIGMSLHFSAGR